MHEAVIKGLREIVGKDRMTISLVDREVYSYCYGVFMKGKPDIIVMPKTPEEISSIHVLANETKTPVIPRGVGTSWMGTNQAPKGGIMLDMALMDKLIEINEDTLVLVAEAGASVYKLMYELDRKGLRFPLTPVYTTGPQLGAAVACNATGLHMTKFGGVGDNVVGLEVVLPTGEIVTLGSGAFGGECGFFHRYMGGMDLIGLFINAGGTTGVITKAAIKVKTKPNYEDVLSYGWPRDKAEDLAQLMSQLHRQYIYDILLVNEWQFYSVRKDLLPPGVHFVAILSIDGDTEEHLRQRLETIKSLCVQRGGKNLGDLAKPMMKAPSYGINLSSKVFSILGRGQTTYFYAPILKFPEIYDLWEGACKKYGFWNEKYLPMWFSFAGRNIINPYPMLGHCDPRDEKELKQVWEWWKYFNIKIAKLGCTQYLMGDGLPKEIYKKIGPLYDLMKKIKITLDPNNIMNPSELFSIDN